MSSNPLNNSVLCSRDNGNIILVTYFVFLFFLLCPVIKCSDEKEMVYLADTSRSWFIMGETQGRNSSRKREAAAVEERCTLAHSLAPAEQISKTA